MTRDQIRKRTCLFCAGLDVTATAFGGMKLTSCICDGEDCGKPRCPFVDAGL